MSAVSVARPNAIPMVAKTVLKGRGMRPIVHCANGVVTDIFQGQTIGRKAMRLAVKYIGGGAWEVRDHSRLSDTFSNEHGGRNGV